MRLLLTGLLIINLCSGNLSANGPMIGNRPEAAQITAATESILNKTIPLINGRARLSISVTIGPSYSFEITEFTTSTSTTPTTTSGTTTTGATTTGATKTGATTTGATKTGATKTGATKTGATKTGATTTGATKTGATTTGTSQGHGRTKIVRADTNPLNGGNRLALITHVKPGSSYSFDTTNVKYSKANEQIHLNVTMCNGNEADAVTVNRSNTDTYEVSAETIKRMIETFNCSVKSRVKRNNENGNYSMTLIIYVDKNDTSNNITIVGYSIYPPSTTTPPSPAPTHTTHTSSPLTSPSPAPTHTPTHTFTAASTTPPASSIGTGWIVAIVLIAIIVVTLIFAIAIFVYFYMKRRRGSINKDREDLSKRQSFVNEVLTRTSPPRKTENGYETPQPSSMIITLPHDTPIILNNPQIIPYSDFPIFHHNSPISHHPYIPQQLTKTSMDQEDSEGYIEITK